MIRIPAGYYRFAIVIAFLGTLEAKELHFCPPADLVKQNEKNIQPWKNNDLFWSIAYRGWPYADQISFSQVFFFPDKNKIDCRYKWMNPKEEGTYLWTSVELNPDSNQKIVITGENWQQITQGMQCSSGRPETCAFEIIRTK